MEPSTLSRGCLKFDGTDIGAGANTSSTTFQTLSKSTTIKYKTFVLELANPAGDDNNKEESATNTSPHLSKPVSDMLFLLATEDWGSFQCHTFSNYPGIQLQKAQNLHACFKLTWLPLQKWKFGKSIIQ